MQARVAALCVLDARVEGLMAQRFSLHHRSLFPHITVCASPCLNSNSCAGE
jgi:hypothetical protein